jgi:hypothetical protein
VPVAKEKVPVAKEKVPVANEKVPVAKEKEKLVDFPVQDYHLYTYTALRMAPGCTLCFGRKTESGYACD